VPPVLRAVSVRLEILGLRAVQERRVYVVRSASRELLALLAYKVSKVLQDSLDLLGSQVPQVN
jgi:hypothetical protein